MTGRVEVLAPDAWAGDVARRLAERLAAEPGLRLCLPTGDTPSPVYAALPAALAACDASFARATVVQLDEWVGLPPGDPARCDLRLREELLRHLDPGPTVVAIAVDELEPAAAAAAHDEAARDLDLVVLGLGMNGHVGFNEPGSTADSPTRVVELDPVTLAAASERYGATRRPQAGITVGLDRLLAAREVWLLVAGERKAGILQRALEGPESGDCPASFLRRHERLTVLADDAAAWRLAEGRRTAS